MAEHPLSKREVVGSNPTGGLLANAGGQSERRDAAAEKFKVSGEGERCQLYERRTKQKYQKRVPRKNGAGELGWGTAREDLRVLPALLQVLGRLLWSASNSQGCKSRRASAVQRQRKWTWKRYHSFASSAGASALECVKWLGLHVKTHCSEMPLTCNVIS